MPSLTCFNRRFTPKWSVIFLVSLVLALFLRLGFWQIQRADEKKQMLAAQQRQMSQAPSEWSGQGQPEQYQNIKLTGHYLAQHFLLDNQYQNHQLGFDVLTALQLTNGQVILIDRGWVPAGASREVLPVINTPKGVQTIQGSVYLPSKKQWVLGPNLEQKRDNICIIERIDAKMLSQILQKKVYPFIIRLDKHEQHGFLRQWAIVSMAPERHLGYALQWFAMALTIFILFVVLNLKRKDEKTGI